ncbi:response regulator transcription factor [Geitlerinema sp. PCC 9228]|uniref:response regulator transcription factor n=1 Tax=Geitlerinema sp. PCC 9228 TaxID=111611 RepID=UPI0008F9A059|nr:response regulator transcription factor [Geitlerinema sp. PCC 9228]
MKILIVEDDDRIAYPLAEALRDRNYSVEIASDGEIGLEFALGFHFDLIVLDLMLPTLDGITLCRRLRDKRLSTLVLMLTAKDSNEDKVVGLDAGADDYIIKPFDLSELLARVRALLRRCHLSYQPVLEWERLTLHPDRCEVRYNDTLLKLTPKEYGLLEVLMRHGSQVLSRQTILDRSWELDDTPGEETVKVHLRSLRKKLKKAGAPANLIETVYGLGYRLNPNL